MRRIADPADIAAAILFLSSDLAAFVTGHSLGAGQNPDTETVGQHRTDDLVAAAPDWTLEQAAHAMVRGNFRHLIVIDGGEVTGLLSMRDIVRSWTPTEIPAAAASA